MPHEAGQHVIDLTNDSDEEGVPPPAAPAQAILQHIPAPDLIPPGPPLDAAARQQLYRAIETCPEERLRDILANMVADDAVSAHALFEHLVAVHPPHLVAEPAQGHAAAAAPKIVPRWATCKYCDEDFDLATEREEFECVYHPGALKAVEMRFPDWDEKMHGSMDTPENRAALPENFVWSCCDRDGDNPEACTEGYHAPQDTEKRRTRY
ncbi:hypothetical protein EVJ58_g4183 [Rhodofomes roseus]|uniref:C2H2-type domain-containing protein n=1 Tax=Rhodofomes roseus TaxID=34475 RepID=A0A4Y9YJR8_9APHY|nr:hypothetical protein EVJ58_g4183 [Rhodofomes roseus]